MILLDIFDIAASAGQDIGTVGVLLLVVYYQYRENEAQKRKLDEAHRRELENLREQIKQLQQDE